MRTLFFAIFILFFIPSTFAPQSPSLNPDPSLSASYHKLFLKNPFFIELNINVKIGFIKGENPWRINIVDKIFTTALSPVCFNQNTKIAASMAGEQTKKILVAFPKGGSKILKKGSDALREIPKVSLPFKKKLF